MAIFKRLQEFAFVSPLYLLTLLSLGNANQLLSVDNIEEILEIEMDVGDHMEMDLQPVTASHALLTQSFDSGEEAKKFEKYLEGLDFLKNTKTITFENGAKSQISR